MKKTNKIFHVLASLVITLVPSYGEIIFSDNFDGSTNNLNGATTDAGAGTWVAASCFDRNGDVNITNANAGSATLAFTPANGLIYTLEASVSLSAGGSGDWVGFGFANGQTSTAGTGARFLTGNTPEGRAWVYARENTNNPRTCLTGSAATPWVGITNSPSNIDYRIVLDTTGGTGTWTATWFAKDSADPTYTEIGSATALTDEDINSVGFCVSGVGVTASISNFTLSDNQAPTAPLLASTNPADDATGVQPDVNLVATFNKPIQLGASGDFTIKNLTTATDTVISLPGPDADGTLTVDGSTLTIDPTDDLGVPGDEIVIEISAGAIESTEAVAYGGLLETDVPNWSFTIDDIPPAPSYFHPIPGSDRAPLDGALFIAFDEAPFIGTGNIEIYRADDTLVETIDVTSVTQNGARIAITPTVPLAYNTSYYVLIDTGAFTDLVGNGYGISDSATWTFTTIANDSTVLFGDSFNRPSDTDLNASAGKYGSLGALTYTSNLIGVASVLLSDGQLLLESNESDGLSGPVVYPNHNFVDAAIESAGGFSVTIDLNVISSTTATRYLSVALGRASADIDAQTSATASGTAATSDLVVALRTNDTLWIYENGVNAAGSNTNVPGVPPATPTKMRIDCSLTDFNATSTVNYEVFFDDSETAFYAGSFTWTGTDQNYISLSSNLLVTATEGERHALVDNLQIRTLGGASSGFDTWKTTNSATGGIDEDHDDDGVSNGVEYFIGGPNGDTTGFTALPGVTNTGGTLSVTFTKAGDYAGAYGTDFVVETSATLANPWTPVAEGVGAGFVEITGNDVKYTFPAGTKNFARLKVTGP